MKRSIRACLHLAAFAGLLAVPCSKAESGYAPTTVSEWNSALNAFIPREICAPSDKCECDGGSGGASGGSGQSATADPMLKCVQMDIGMGAPRYSALSGAIVLQLNELQASSRLYSPAGFHVVAGHTVHRVSRQTNAGGVPKWVQVSTPSGVVAEYVFADGESVGVPVSGREDVSSGRLAMVDAQGWAAAADPAFYDYYPGDGSRWRFGAVKGAPDYLGLIEHQTPQGRVETKQDMGLEILRDVDGALRQVATPARLADFVVTGQDAYDLTVYPNDASCVTGARTADGYFQIAAGAVPEVVWKFRNPAPGTYGVLEVMREMPGAGARTWRYEYVEAVQDFILKHPGGIKEERVERIESDDKKSRTVRRTELGPDGVAYSKKELRYETRGGSLEIVASVKDPGGLNLTTAYDYYTEGVCVGLERMSVSPEGSWTRYEYDGQKRKTAVVTPWLDSPTNALDNQCAITRYNYTVFALGDFLAYNDQRPRLETKEICGVEVSRTYRAYPTNALGQAQEIVERAAFQGAPYGHASNPRMVKTYYAASAALPLPGRLATVAYPGGKTETYGYEYGTFNAATFTFAADSDGGAWRETVTTAYSATPNSSFLTPKSTRSVRVWDERGSEVLDESCVEDGASFARIGWTRKSYDRNCKLTETAYSDGRVVSATWGANCCGKESETSAEGIITVYGYNELKQKVSETKKGMAADGADDLTTLYTYDLNNRVLSVAVTNLASGLGYVASRSAYDAVGRLTNSVDRLGNPTVTAYDTLVTSVHRPNGVTVVTEWHLDGQTKRVFENGVVKQSYAFGISADGTQWTLSADGPLPAIAPLTDVTDLRPLASGFNFPWQLQAADPLGRSVANYKPGFGRALLVTSSAYDTAGSLSRAERRVSGVENRLLDATLYAHDAAGNLVLTALDLNTNGVIDLSGPDRVTGTSAGYEKDAANVWWRVARSWVYPEFNSTAAVTTSVQRVQLTGIGVRREEDGVLVSHSEAFDIRGNITTPEVLVDRTARRLLQVTTLPTSVQPTVQTSVNGLLRQTVSSTAVTNTFGYDFLGRRNAATDGRGNTTFTDYDVLGQVVYTEDAATNRTICAYDSLGRRTDVTDALGNVIHTRYDADNRVVAKWGATYPMAYSYDAQGRMTEMGTYRGAIEITDYGSFQTLVPSFDKTHWMYEQPTGLLTNKSYADGKGPSYSYTSDGKLESRLWARDVLTSYAYDAVGSLVGVDYFDDTPDIAYTFDRLGRQLSAISSVSTNLFAYSPQTLDLVSETQNGTVITRAADAFGRSSGVGFWDSYAVAYGYDDLGRFASVSSSVCLVSFGVNYSRLPGTDLITGYTATSPVSNFEFQVSKTYEPHRNLITSVSNHVNHVNPVLISAYDYTNDALGRRVSRHDSGLAFAQSQVNTFGYNQRSEVACAVMYTNVYGYVYDPIGNRLVSSHNAETNTYVANALDQYTAISALSAPPREPTYDLDGNMTYDGKEWFYFWNAENRLILASNAQHVVSYTYDHRGRMVEKKTERKDVETQSGVVEKSMVYLWDGYNIILDKQSASDTNELTNLYFWGLDLSGTLQGAGGVGGFFAVSTINQQQSTTNSFYSAYDANGNVTEYIDVEGFMAAHSEYSAFGEATGITGSFPFTRRWSTKLLCSSTGLIEYEFRKYNPILGRWLNRDPVLENGWREVFESGMCGKNVAYSGNAELPLTTTCSLLLKDRYADVYLFVDNSSINSSDFRGLLRDCAAEQIQCFRDCWGKCPPWPINRGDRGHYLYCQTLCLGKYMECEAENALERVFDTLESALAWLRDHPEVVIGTVVVIGGIAYVVATGGTGALILIPATL